MQKERLCLALSGTLRESSSFLVLNCIEAVAKIDHFYAEIGGILGYSLPIFENAHSSLQKGLLSSIFIQNEDKPLDVKEINTIVLSTLSSSGIDISKFKYHSTSLFLLTIIYISVKI
ncbi:hypothetical protein ACTFIW_005499 [Dictyostelium discoideum]